MLTQIKNNSEGKKITKGNLISRVFSVCKKVTAMFCAIGLVMIMNAPLVFAYEAHTVNVTARIVNDIPSCIVPPDGEFCSTGEFKVELSVSVSLDSADIYYTIDGSNPICGGNIYSEPFALPSGITLVKAVACHYVTRNGGQVLIKSAVMAEEFNGSAPIVKVVIDDYEYFCEDRDAMIWYCNPTNPITYPIEWIVENYRDADELSIDIVYITDNDDNGIISDGDNRFSIANNLTGAIGSYPFVLVQEYCYYGYGWAKVIATEASTDPNTDNCKNFGISGRIFDPMICDSPDISVSDNIPVIPESEPVIDPIIDNDDSDDISNNADNTSDDNSNDDSDLNSEDIDVDNVPEENIEEDDASEDIRNENSEEDADNNTDADDPDLLNEDEENGEEDLDDDEDGGDETDENVEDENADDLDNAEENVGADENIVLENDGIIMDREEDFDEEENSNESDDDEDDSIIANSDVSLDGDDLDDESIDDDSDSDDNDSDNDDDDSFDNDAPIEGDDDSTEIGFSL